MRRFGKTSQNLLLRKWLELLQEPPVGWMLRSTASTSHPRPWAVQRHWNHKTCTCAIRGQSPNHCQTLFSGQTVRYFPACCRCQAGMTLHSSLRGGSLRPAGKARSADTEGLERGYLPVPSRFVVGSAFILETQPNCMAAVTGVWATTHSAKPLLSHRGIPTPGSQSVSFKMRGEDREHGVKDGWRFQRVARKKELGEQSKINIDALIWSSISRDQLFRKLKHVLGARINISLMTKTRGRVQTGWMDTGLVLASAETFYPQIIAVIDQAVTTEHIC